ncbi:AI-2E family transporter [Thiocystis violacea]|nr:AI-2E family transporter [Thiocystis violacea]
MIEQRSPGKSEAVDRAVEIAIRLGLLALMLTLCFLIVRPFLVAIVWGGIIAVAVHPGYRQLLRAVAGRRALASVLFALLALVVLIGPIVMLSGTLVQGAQSLNRGFADGGLDLPPPPDLSFIPLIGQSVQDFWQKASSNLEGALRTIEPQLRQVGEWTLSLAKNAGLGILNFGLAIVIAAVLLAKSAAGGRASRALAERLAGARGRQFVELAEAVVRAVSRGILGVAMLQALLTGLGMLAAGVPAAGLWALIALLLSTIQIGVFPVLLPAAVYVFYAGDTLTAVLFLIWAILVGSLDNVLKPILLGRGVAVPTAVIFVGAIGGFIGAGIIGLFVGAVILVLGYELFMAWLREGHAADEAGSDPQSETEAPPR